MSALAVLLVLDDRLVPAARFKRLLDLQKTSGPDSQLSAICGPAALGIAVLNTTPEDHLDPPCLRDPDSGIVVVFDGYLSNRIEIAESIGMSHAELNVCGDARLVANAYERWQNDAFAKLVGEFALALWDPRERQLLVVRDALGLRPVFYRNSPHEFTVATELQALIRTDPSPLNEAMIGEALVGRASNAEETLFTDVKRLLPAHLLIARADGHCRIHKYWSPELGDTLDLRDDDEYAEAFAEQMDRAVAASLRADRPVAVMLSGGLDSSVIVAAATSHRRVGREQPLSSLTIGYPGHEVDESSLAASVAAHVAIPWQMVEPSAASYDYLADAAESLQLPPFPSGANASGLRAAAVAQGSRVLLNGVGGDEWFYGSRWRYADFLRGGQFIEWGREVMADRRTFGRRPLRSLLRDSIFPMIPAPWWRQARQVLGRAPVFDLLTPSFVGRIGLHDRYIQRALPFATSYARRDIVREALGPAAIGAGEELARAGARGGNADRRPFFDRRLVSFALSLPETQRRAAGMNKRVVRRAYRSELPATVIGRAIYFDHSFLVTGAVRTLLDGGMVDRPRIVENGWADRHLVKRLIDAVRARDSVHAEAAALRLWPALAVEVWLTSVLQSTRSDGKSPA